MGRRSKEQDKAAEKERNKAAEPVDTSADSAGVIENPDDLAETEAGAVAESAPDLAELSDNGDSATNSSLACDQEPIENAPQTTVKPTENPYERPPTPKTGPSERMETGSAARVEAAAATAVKAIGVAQEAIEALRRASPSTVCAECVGALARVRTRLRQQYPMPPHPGSPPIGG